MDTNTIFTKTAKGASAAAGKSKALTRDERALLNEIDGQSPLGMLAQRLGISEARLRERLAPLVAADYIRAFVAPDDAFDEALDSDLDLAQLPVLEDAMGAETIFAFLQETERQAQQAAEDRLSRETERQPDPDADERARRDAEELARRKATVARIRQEALDKYRRDIARQAQEQAEQQRRLKAEELARLAAQEQARRDAEEQARRAAEQRAQDAAAALARQRAEQQAQHAAELQARREAAEEALQLAERMRQEQQQRARREAADKAARDAAEQTRRAERELAREKAEQRAQRKAEQKAQRAARQAERAAREQEIREAELRDAREQALAVDAAIAAHESKLPTVWLTENTASLLALDVPADAVAAPGHDDGPEPAAPGPCVPEPVLAAANRIKHYRKPSRWRLPIALALGGAVAAGIVWAQTLSFDGRRIEFEQQAGAAFGQPVSIGQVHLAWLPLPHWRIEDVAIGARGQIRVARVDAVPRLDTLLGERPAYHSVTLQSPAVDEEGLGWLLYGKARQHAIAVDGIVAHQARLVSPRIDLPSFEIDAAIGRDGNWTSAALHNAERQLRIDLRPHGEAVAVDLRAAAFASSFGDFGATVALDQFVASGQATRKELTLSTVNGELLGGSISGNARLQWSTEWALDGTFKAHRIDATRLAPQLFESGKLDGRAEIAWHASDAGRLFAAPRIKGEAGVRNGVLRGVDLAGAARAGDSRGKTAFSDLDGAFTQERGRLQLRSLRLGAGLLSAGGDAEVDAGGKLAGRFVVDLKASARQARGRVGLNGTLAQPRFE